MTADGNVTALDPGELARLSSMAVRARVIVEGAFAGLHHNPHQGSAIEFAEHKEYAPGDEIRRIDWKAVGRQDRYYVKQYEDETEMRTFLVMDTSGSMGYGRSGVSKLTYATYLGAALAYLLGKQGDPAGLMLFDAELRYYLPPSSGVGQLGELLRTLEDLKAEGATDLARALERVGDVARRRSLIVVFSDLLDAEPGMTPEESQPEKSQPEDVARGAVATGLARLRQRGHDVVLFHLLDPDEVSLPFRDLVQFHAVEPSDERTLLVDAEDLRESFQEESRRFRERWRQACLQSQVEYRFTTTKEAPGSILRSFIGERGRTR